MAKVNGVFLDRDSVGSDLDLSVLTDLDVNWTFFPSTTYEQTQERCQNAQIVITNKVVLDRQILSSLPELQLICVAATGMNNIDIEASDELGIEVKNVAGYAGSSVAQVVFSVLLELTTHTNRYSQLVKAGNWSKSPFFCLLDFPIQELAGKTMGLVGYGDLAKSVEKLALAFDMTVLVAERKGATTIREGRVDFNEVLQQADVISIHCPLTEHSKNLIGREELGKMKSNAILINSARGGIVNEQALLDALESKQIAAAAMDVLTEEPPKPDHNLLSHQPDNLIITPHIAWASVEARTRLLTQLAENIKQRYS